MGSYQSKGSSAARSKASGFSLDYACSLSVRKAKGSSKARSSGSARRSHDRKEV